MMYSLVLGRHQVLPEEAKEFVKAVCDPVAHQQAINNSQWDVENKVVVVKEATDREAQAEEASERHYFDFDIRDYVEIDEGHPRVSRANMEVGLEFDPDAQSLGSTRTAEYLARRQGSGNPRAASESLIDGAAGLEQAVRDSQAAAAARQAQSLANDEGTARHEPPPSPGKGCCGGGNS